MKTGQNHRRFRGERTPSEEMRLYLEQLIDLRTKTIEQMVNVLEDCRDIFNGVMQRATEEQTNPKIRESIEHLAVLNNRIKNALDVAKVL